MGHGGCCIDGYCVGQWTSMLKSVICIIDLCFALFIFALCFPLSSAFRLWLWNTSAGHATRLGRFPGYYSFAACELHYKFYRGEQCWQCCSCPHGSSCTKDQGLSSTPIDSISQCCCSSKFVLSPAWQELSISYGDKVFCFCDESWLQVVGRFQCLEVTECSCWVCYLKTSYELTNIPSESTCLSSLTPQWV